MGINEVPINNNNFAMVRIGMPLFTMSFVILSISKISKKEERKITLNKNGIMK